MKAKILLLLGLFTLLTVSYPAPAFAPVEYVKICSIYGANYYYSPGTDSCVNAISGEVRKQFDNGGTPATINRQTYVTARVRALESNFCNDCFAVVSNAGATTRSALLDTSTRLGPGRYTVTFTKRVDQCAFNATLGNANDSSSQPLPGMIAVAQAAGTNLGVTVFTYNATGDLTDRAFHLSFECEKKRPYCTVTDQAGTNTTACTGNETVTDLGPPGH
jgi:hypothetical protein